MKTYIFEIEIEQEEDGRWSAGISSIPVCAAWGYTKEEATEALRELTQAYLEVLIEDNEPLPEEFETNTLVSTSEVVTVRV